MFKSWEVFGGAPAGFDGQLKKYCKTHVYSIAGMGLRLVSVIVTKLIHWFKSSFLDTQKIHGYFSTRTKSILGSSKHDQTFSGLKSSATKNHRGSFCMQRSISSIWMEFPPGVGPDTGSSRRSKLSIFGCGCLFQ